MSIIIKNIEYTIIEELGKGGFGKVSKVLSKSDNEYYAIKEIPIKGESEEQIKIFQNEAEILSKFNCNNIVKYYDSSKDDNNIYILMEFCGDENLRSFIDKYKNNGELIEENIINNIIKQICIGIKEMHDKKIIHRDIKPENIFMNKNMDIKIGDFGISKQLNIYKTHSLTINKAGSNYYISPEILIKGIYNEKSDIWSLGCIIYELFTLNIYYNDKMMNDIKKINTDIYNYKWQKLIDSLLQVDYTKRLDIGQVIIFLEGELKTKINNKENNIEKYVAKIPKFNNNHNIVYIKIILIGNSRTNKSEFVNKYSKNIFINTDKASIVGEFGFKIFEFEGNLYRVQLWDLAGSEKILITKIYVKDSHGLVVMSSAENIQTRNDSIEWKKKVDEYIIYPDGKELPCILVENNIDLLPNNKRFDPTFEEFWKKNGFTCGFRVSSKTGENVNESMEYFIKEIVKRMKNINEKIKTGEISDKYFVKEEKIPSKRPINDKVCILF